MRRSPPWSSPPSTSACAWASTRRCRSSGRSPPVSSPRTSTATSATSASGSSSRPWPSCWPARTTMRPAGGASLRAARCHRAVLLEAEDPAYLGPLSHLVVGTLLGLPELEEAFRTGAGSLPRLRRRTAARARSPQRCHLRPVARPVDRRDARHRRAPAGPPWRGGARRRLRHRPLEPRHRTCLPERHGARHRPRRHLGGRPGSRGARRSGGSGDVRRRRMPPPWPATGNGATTS
jgi:hypothetical protein